MIPAHLQERTLEQLRATQETIRCFMVGLTGEAYTSLIVCEDGDKKCVGGFDYHRGEIIIDRYSLDSHTDEYPKGWPSDDEKRAKAPRYCTRCGNWEFSAEAVQKCSSGKGRVWERIDTGERADNLNAFGPGAMWYITWFKNKETGLYWHQGFKTEQQHPPLCIRTPGGDWTVDSRASNCTLPEDENHKCWPHRGTPPILTVDKSYGPTCNAGSGSIIAGNWHGFLRNGFLVKC